jgi:hypothetical protein
MRRSIVIAVLVGALVGLAAAAGITLAGGGSGSSSGTDSSAGASQGSFASQFAKKQGNRGRGGRRGGRHGHGHGLFFGPVRMAFNGVADRLGVEPRDLRDAAKGVKRRALDRAVSEGTITADERAALEACMKNRGGSGCDRAKARAAHRKLHRAFKQRIRSDAAGLKNQVLEDLAAELGGGKSAAQIDAAIRAELVELLDKGVSMGFLTERARELALECWDTPNQCDRKALRAEVRKRFRGHRHGGGRRHP